MKKKIIIISAMLIGFVLTVSGNSWAQRERGGGHFQKWDKPAVHKFDQSDGQGYHHRRYDQTYRPVHRFKPKFHNGHQYRAPHRNRHWWHRPYYRHWKFKRHYWRHHRRPVINNYYSSSEGYAAPEEEFHASASVSDSGFSVSVGVNKTD